ncbi:MAG: response regulator transcription factor [Christensenellales bacterium]|jgi:two-component system OmpR family response regulator
MKDNTTILMIDDDKNICRIVTLYLEKEGFKVETVNNGTEGLKRFRELSPAMVLLDVMLPGMDGWQICREIREESDVPIIMLTAKGEVFDKILGLELGADDYLAKPFDTKELVARVKAVIRRSIKQEDDSGEVSFDRLSVNLSNYSVVCDGKEIEMPPKEIELLYFLASHANKVFTREQLLEQVWGFDYFGDSRTVDVHIKRIREKLNVENVPWQVKTVWGVGYKFEVK